MSEVSWLAVIVATVLSFMLGGLWYSPRVFGARWAEGCGVDLESEDAGKHAVKALSVQFVSTLLLAWLLGAMVDAGEWLMIAVTVSVVAVILISAGLFHRNSHFAAVIEGVFVVVMSAVMVVVHLVL
ncbi:MAG: DUF1761 domain-containing protein [Gammaproteobacteria bacterium]|nr:DUF1761 domain-containing protein [Gammaproteobacteria bacterium]MDE0478708.1 DUF1761 domain-containing protein [Gammaproteobacteria bacterium]MDE0508691.1 DUF1761 domain-containing protein [Gammaproteobacteria bacterium]MYA37264.1 DUF1761 domain-containing protein [Gammaproteobacteria bacterium]MYH86905.1 DUF1761 domain-containing protein [Gammaproteobacteria bacterium]